MSPSVSIKSNNISKRSDIELGGYLVFVQFILMYAKDTGSNCNLRAGKTAFFGGR